MLDFMFCAKKHESGVSLQTYGVWIDEKLRVCNACGYFSLFSKETFFY